MSENTVGLPMPPNVRMLELQMLRWLHDCPRTYADTMDAWRTSCPRLSVWEDATAEGLVEVVRGSARGQSTSRVQLTDKGMARLRQQPAG